MFDVTVIGGGVVGAAILDALAIKGYKVLLLEKEDDVATGASRANSGISHAGYDAVPQTLKAKFNVEGNRLMPDLCEALDVPYAAVGSLVLSRDYDSPMLRELYERGAKNGVETEIIDREKIDEIQPEIADDIKAALYAKSAGIVSPYKLTIALSDRAALNGAEIVLNANVSEITFNDGVFTVKTQDKSFETKYLVNSAGSNAGEINGLLGEEVYKTEFKKGEYYVLDKTEGTCIKTVLFPLPDERGKGILVAPTADGNVIYGPTSEGCDKDDTSCTARGLEAVRDGVSGIIKNPNFKKVIREYAGVRAVVGEDFIVKRSEKYDNYFILAGICSPGLTSAPAIGQYLAEEISKEYKVVKNEKPVVRLHHDYVRNMSEDMLNEKVREDIRWGRIICRCERVSEAEIVNAIHSPLPATTVDAVKRRVRAGMGRCQGGFCAPRVISILSRELGIPMTEVKKGGVGSEMLACRVKEVADENL